LISLNKGDLLVDKTNLTVLGNNNKYSRTAFPLKLSPGDYEYACYYFLKQFNYITLAAMPYHIQIHEPSTSF